MGESQGGAVHVDSVVPLFVKAGADREICDNVKEETKIVPADLSSRKSVSFLMLLFLLIAYMQIQQG